MSVTHWLVNGADRGDWLLCIKRHKWEVFEPRGHDAPNGVLGARRRTEGRSGGPEAATSFHSPKADLNLPPRHLLSVAVSSPPSDDWLVRAPARHR